MLQLTLYLDTLIPKPKPKPITCCSYKENIIISESLLLYICGECGTVVDGYLYEMNYYEKFKNPHIVKTYIPYSYKYKHLNRLNKWGNYSYHEVQMDKLLKEIDIKLIDFDNEIKSFTKIIFKQMYKNLSIRAKIKDSLIVYCLFKTSLMLKKELDLDVLLKLFNISIKNYNDLNKKLEKDKLIYCKDLNEYLQHLHYKMNKNNLIVIYNKFLEFNNRKFNNKSIILGIIYYILENNKEFNKKDFFKIYNISKSSIRNVKIFIRDNSII